MAGMAATAEPTLFQKIIARQIPAKIAYEDDHYIAIHDISPQAPVHILIIPKEHYPTVLDVHDADVLGRAMLILNQLAREQNLADSGYRIVANCKDDGGKTVYHVHIHLLGGRFMSWPPG